MTASRVNMRIVTATAAQSTTVFIDSQRLDVLPLGARCLQRSPSVSASPPHPQIQEQYRFPWNSTRTGMMTNARNAPHTIHTWLGPPKKV